MQTEYHYAWLQSQPMVWYKKHIRKLNKDEKVSAINYNNIIKRVIILNSLVQVDKKKFYKIFFPLYPSIVIINKTVFNFNSNH